MKKIFKKRKYNDLFFEESVVDGFCQSLDAMEMPLSKGAFKLVVVSAFIIALIMLSRIGYLNAGVGNFYAHSALSNMSDFTVIPAERGIFFDRAGKPLVKNIPSFRVVLKLSGFLKKDINIQNSEIEKLANILNSNSNDIYEWLSNADLEKQNLIVIGRDLSVEQVAQIKNLNFDDISIENDYYRQYDEPGILSHVVGYVGIASKNDLKNKPDLLLNDMVGKSGLEFQYDDQLRGKNGEIVEYRNAKNESLGQKSQIQPIRGNNFYLTIDSDLQTLLYNRLKDQLKSLGRVAGAGVAINPNSGEILALVSLPSFDNNNITKDDLINSNRPLFNRVVSGLYNPASTIKPLVGIAALSEGVIDSNKQIYSAGYIDIPNPYHPNQPTRFVDWKKQGWVNLYSALARSSNVYFYEVGGGFGDIKGLGFARLRDYWKKFNLDQKTNIDLPGEKFGFLPDVAEKEKRSGTPWRLGDTYHVSIGQGDLSITPIELINYIATIANKGKMSQPFLVKKITNQNGDIIKETQPKLIKDISYLKPAMDEVEKGMIEGSTKDYGTSYLLKNIPMTIAAKTGSAQYSGNTKVNAYFVGYGPVGGDLNKQIALLIMIEDAREGSMNAVPVAKDLFQWYYTNRIKN